MLLLKMYVFKVKTEYKYANFLYLYIPRVINLLKLIMYNRIIYRNRRVDRLTPDSENTITLDNSPYF